QGQVQTYAGFQQVLYLLVRLCAAKGAVQAGKNDLRYFEAQRTGYLPAYQLGNQRLFSLPGAAELQHIQEAVVRFRNGRHGAAFPQGRNIAGDVDSPDLWMIMVHKRAKYSANFQEGLLSSRNAAALARHSTISRLHSTP